MRLLPMPPRVRVHGVLPMRRLHSLHLAGSRCERDARTTSRKQGAAVSDAVPMIARCRRVRPTFTAPRWRSLAPPSACSATSWRISRTRCSRSTKTASSGGDSARRASGPPRAYDPRRAPPHLRDRLPHRRPRRRAGRLGGGAVAAASMRAEEGDGPMSKHTPGPWSLSDGWQPDPHAIVDTQNVYGAAPAGVVAHVVRASQDGEYSAEREANARLIAKAPEMQEVLVRVSRGEGAFTLDPLRHASNVIEEHKEIARALLSEPDR